MRKTLVFLLVTMACGGSKGQVAEPTPGDTHVPTPDAAPVSTETPPAPPATQPADSIAVPQPPPGGTSIVLKNDGTTDLNFGVTKGWAPVIFAYTGKPPKAKSVFLFETACGSSSCDAAPDAMCPACPEPKDKKEEQAMAKVETVAAGKTLSVPWDGKVLVYEKAAGKKKCKCWRKMEPAADSYTIKACGLRPAPQPGKPSKPMCTETVVTLGPGATNPPEITLSFK